MKFYLIDDDQNIINILKLIIQNRNLGEICGKKVFSLRFLYSEWIYVETGIRYNRSEN